jgi:hypothetical protein
MAHRRLGPQFYGWSKNASPETNTRFDSPQFVFGTGLLEYEVEEGIKSGVWYA